MTDFETQRPGLESPASRAAAVTPDDTTDLPVPCRGLYIGGTGDVEVVTTGGDTVVLFNVSAGSFVPVRCSRVRAAGTTAAAIVALW